MALLLLYNLLLLALGVIAAPIAALVAIARPSWRRGLGERLGFGWPDPGSRAVLWAHAASVGEVEGVVPLVRRWCEANPGGAVVFSALTGSGCDTARRLLPDATVRTFPLDLPWITRSIVRRLHPRIFLFSENEIWPNLIFALHRARVPAIQVSGRLSPGAARTLARFPRFTSEVMRRVTRFCVQAEEHRERLLGLGVAPERVIVTGSLKGDDRSPDRASFVDALAGLRRPVLVAGSTHPGEETAVLDALDALDATRRTDAVGEAETDAFLVLAPRHPERFSQVATLLEKRGRRFVRRTALPPAAAEIAARLAACDVLLLDTIGELAGCFTVAAVAFVGGTIAPVGGHNLLEPARCGVPIAVGPHLSSVEEISRRLIAAGAAVVVADGGSLAAAFARFLDPSASGVARSAAREVARSSGGGLLATWRALAPIAGLAPDPAESPVRVTTAVLPDGNGGA